MTDTRVLHLKTPKFPQFRFEYHEAAKKVYIIRATAPTMGDPIAENINTEGGAWNAVNIWLRGYKEGKGELNVFQQNKRSPLVAS